MSGEASFVLFEVIHAEVPARSAEAVIGKVSHLRPSADSLDYVLANSQSQPIRRYRYMCCLFNWARFFGWYGECCNRRSRLLLKWLLMCLGW